MWVPTTHSESSSYPSPESPDKMSTMSLNDDFDTGDNVQTSPGTSNSQSTQDYQANFDRSSGVLNRILENARTKRVRRMKNLRSRIYDQTSTAAKGFTPGNATSRFKFHQEESDSPNQGIMGTNVERVVGADNPNTTEDGNKDDIPVTLSPEHDDETSLHPESSDSPSPQSTENPEQKEMYHVDVALNDIAVVLIKAERGFMVVIENPAARASIRTGSIPGTTPSHNTGGASTTGVFLVYTNSRGYQRKCTARTHHKCRT